MFLIMVCCIHGICHMFIYIYIYIYMKNKKASSVFYMYVYIYIYIYRTNFLICMHLRLVIHLYIFQPLSRPSTLIDLSKKEKHGIHLAYIFLLWDIHCSSSSICRTGTLLYFTGTFTFSYCLQEYMQWI